MVLTRTELWQCQGGTVLKYISDDLIHIIDAVFCFFCGTQNAAVIAFILVDPLPKMVLMTTPTLSS